jgi:hypothetical protein
MVPRHPDAFNNHPMQLMPRWAAQATLSAMSKGLTDLLGTVPSVSLDEPLRAPAMPFYGLTEETRNAERAPWHIIYELRKDVLVGLHSVDAWLRTLAEMQRRLSW